MASVDDRIRDALQVQAASTRAEFIRALDSQKTQLSDLSHVAAEVLHSRDQQVHPHQLPLLGVPHPTTVTLTVHCVLCTVLYTSKGTQRPLARLACHKARTSRMHACTPS